MRITFNPNIMNTSPIRPVHRVMRKAPQTAAESVEHEPETAAPVTTSVSQFGRMLSKEEQEVRERDYKKKNPLWNTMLNL
jgi:hypothetical protein